MIITRTVWKCTELHQPKYVLLAWLCLLALLAWFDHVMTALEQTNVPAATEEHCQVPSLLLNKLLTVLLTQRVITGHWKYTPYKNGTLEVWALFWNYADTFFTTAIFSSETLLVSHAKNAYWVVMLYSGHVCQFSIPLWDWFMHLDWNIQASLHMNKWSFTLNKLNK